MASEPPPYTIFNDSFSSQTTRENHIFSPFPRLPVEIRHLIWTESIQSTRFIRIYLDNPRLRSSSGLYVTKNELGNIVSGCPYRMRAANSNEWSPNTLLKVSREASGIFHSVFRVRIPLPVKGGDGGIKTLYINPENDILWVVSDQNNGDGISLIAFLHDLVAYDPRGVGVVHLAIGGTTLNDQSRLAELHPADLCLPARQSITKLLSTSLQSLYAVISPHIEARTMLGVMSWPRGQFHHNRSLPIIPQTKSYTFLKHDPRPIVADLAHVAVGIDPRRTVWHWNRFMANFGVERHLNISYILGIVQRFKQIELDGREGFVAFLQESDERWAEFTDMVGQQIWGERMSREEYEAQRTSLPQAAGFWVFPRDALGDIPDVRETRCMENGPWEPKMVKDLTKFHPGICVFSLPEKHS